MENIEKQKKPRKAPTSIRLKAEFEEKARADAKQKKMSFNAWVNELLRNELERGLAINRKEVARLLVLETENMRLYQAMRQLACDQELIGLIEDAMALSPARRAFLMKLMGKR